MGSSLSAANDAFTHFGTIDRRRRTDRCEETRYRLVL
jgi:hypothetical protein